MKKKILFLTVVMALLLIQICCAAPVRDVPREDIAIGGIYFGATENYVRSIYGNPDKVSYRAGNYPEPKDLIVWRYGETFEIIFDSEDDKVYKVKSTGKNGLKTPVDFCVGNNIFSVQKYYDGRCSFSKNNGKYYLRIHSNGGIYMMFTATPDAEIKEISLYPEV